MSISKLINNIGKENLADNIDPEQLDKIGYNCYVGYKKDEDDEDRAKWAKNIDEYVKMAMQIVEKKSDPWPGCANIKLPILTEAAIQFNARAYPALVPSTDVVRCATTGSDTEGVKMDRGDRVGKHMSYQLKNEMSEWEGDMDKGLLILPLLGCFFKKTLHNTDLGRNESKLVMPQNLVLEYKAPSIERAPRISEVIEFYPKEVKEKQRSKIWLDVELEYVDEDTEELEEFITQHTYLDLYDLDNKAEKGYKCPYVVTLHEKTKKVMRIVANYTESDIYFNDGTEIVSVRDVNEEVAKRNAEINKANIDNLAIAQQAGDPNPIQLKEVPAIKFDKYKVSRVEATQYYTRYIFLPSPDGSIYGMGLGQLLGPMIDTADALVNQMLDAGSASNLQGGFKARGAKVPSGINRVNVTEWTEVETSGMSIRDSFLPFNFRGPSPTAFSLLGFLIDNAKAVANLKDILSGEAPQGETATTSMIKREEGMRIYNAIYKRIYRSFREELQKLYDLNSNYLPQEAYFMVLDEKEAIKRSDYSFDKTDIQPTADPSESMQSQKIAKAEAGLQFLGDPQCNPYELKKRYFEAIEMPSIDAILPPPSNEPQPPPPELVKITAEVQKIEAETKKTLLETAEVISKVIKNLAEAESKEVGTQMQMLQTHANLLISQGVGNGAIEDGSQGVEESPGNEAIMEGLPTADIGAGGTI